jgi:hypothetical protein
MNEATDTENDAVGLLEVAGGANSAEFEAEPKRDARPEQPSSNDATSRSAGPRRLLEHAVGTARSVAGYFQELTRVYTGRFLALLTLVQLLLKGFVYITVGKGMFPIMRALNVEAERTQVYSNAATSPWAIKPLVGVLSDVLVIGGRRKKYFLLLATVVGCAGAILLCFGVSKELVVTFGMFMMR